MRAGRYADIINGDAMVRALVYVAWGAVLAVLPCGLVGAEESAMNRPSVPDSTEPRQYEEFKPLTGLDNTPKGGTLPGGTLPGGPLKGGSLPGGTVPGGTVPGGTLPGGTVPGGTLPGGTLPGGTLPGGTVPGGPLEGGPL